MTHLFNLLLITLLLLNLAGIGVVAAHFSKLPYGTAKSAAIVLLCAVFFCLEHYIGLGSLGWLLPISTVASVWVLWKKRATLRGHAWGEAGFLFGCLYALMWRYHLPDINPSSEKLADLNFVAGYMAGSKLPAADPWLHPYLLTQYYMFQHYAAALLGRVLSQPCGVAYNLGYCVLVGCVTAPARDVVRAFTPKKWHQILVVSALLMGGTGACFFTPLLVKNNKLHSSMRFIGATDADGDAELKPLGIALRKFTYGEAPIDGARRELVLEMPMEIFSYVVQLGDYHAPMGGYVVLLLALAAFAILIRDRTNRWAWGILAGTIPVCIAVNTWSFPLQTLLVMAFIGFIWIYRGRSDWKTLAASFVGVSALFYPFFAYFLTMNIGGGMSVDIVGAGQHAPPMSYLMQFWPTLGLLVLACFAADKRHREFLCLPIIVAFFLLLIEMLNVNDIYSGRFERFNTTLKWWPWVAALALMLLAPLNLGAAKRPAIIRIGTAGVLLAILAYVVPLGLKWKDELRYSRSYGGVGLLDGAEWMRQMGIPPEVADRQGKKERREPLNATVNASIMAYLSRQPTGVILEPCDPEEKQAFCNTGAITLFTGHKAVFGWASHEQLWRGYQTDIVFRWDRVREIFRGEHPNPLEFLDAHQVDYILWPGTMGAEQGLFDKIQAQIAPRYQFLSFDTGARTRGIFIKRPVEK